MKALQTLRFEGLFEWQKAACTFHFKRDYNIAN